MVLRVDSPPDWANNNGGDQIPPSNPDDFRTFMYELSKFLKGRVAAYEIWNEPNLSREWGNRTPNASEYVALLRAGYEGVKAGDPRALVISAGLATTGGGDGAMNDIDFIRGMYAAGAKAYFDVLGSHPYGFGSAPETEPWGAGVLFFRRAEAQRQVMLDNGDGAKQIWATEFGWPVDTTCYLGGHDWFKQPPDVQADYLVRSYQYAYANWPWMGVMLTFNLDFSSVYWYDTCDPVRYYAVMDGNPSTGELWPRPAYTALSNMTKTTSH